MARFAAVGLLAICGFVAAGCGMFGPDDADETITIEGRVYARCAFNSSGSCTKTDPVSGAVVATSLSAVTATTDAGGNFVLDTGAPKSAAADCKSYTITVTATGFPVYTVTGFGQHATGQEYVMADGSMPIPPTCK